MSDMDNKDILNEEASLLEGGGTAVGGDGGSFSTETPANETPSVCPADSQLPQGGSLDSNEPDCDAAPQREPWYIDLSRDEFVEFRLLMARLMGPLRQRIPMLIVSLFSFAMLVGYAVFEWLAGWVASPDPVLLVGGALVLIPALVFAFYLPHRIRRMAEKQYDLAIILNDPSLQDIWDLSAIGKRMPKKTTYFFPKIWSGFVFYKMA